MRYRRTIPITATAVAFCLISSAGWAQQAGNENSSLFGSMTQFLRFDPLLVAALVIALTLVIGLALDTVRGRFRRSEGGETPAPPPWRRNKST